MAVGAQYNRAGHGNLKHATYWNTSAMSNSKAMKPDVVIYMLGTNDADEWYNTRCVQMKTHARARQRRHGLGEGTGQGRVVATMCLPPVCFVFQTSYFVMCPAPSSICHAANITTRT